MNYIKNMFKMLDNDFMIKRKRNPYHKDKKP